MEKKKKLRIRYRLSIVFFATVLIFGVTFYKYVKSTTLEDVLSSERTITVFKDNTTISKDGDSSSNESEPEEETGVPGEVINPVPQTEAPKDESYLDSCIFVGDSVAYGLGSYNVVPSSRVFASVSMTIASADTDKIDVSGESVSVLEALQKAAPENVYLLFSSASAAYSTPDELYLSYSAFLNKLRIAVPKAKVYVISVPPVTESKEKSVTSPIKNADIDSLNEMLLKYCDDNGIRYLDFDTVLKNDRGRFNDDYAENDGLHFKRSAYTELINYILSHTA